MAIRIFTVPFDPVNEVFTDDDVKKFLLNKHINRIQTEFFKVYEKPYWTLVIDYEPVIDTDQNDVVENLSDEQKLLYKRLKQWRRERAEKDDNPVFFIGTNNHLADLVRRAPKTIEALREVKGFGRKKTEKYGKELIEIITAFYETQAVKGFQAKAEGKEATKTTDNNQKRGESHRSCKIREY